MTMGGTEIRKRRGRPPLNRGALEDPAVGPEAAIDVVSGADALNLRERLREDVITGRMIPGHRLRLEELRTHYNASVGSLREALMQLVSEGFVIAEANRGFCVAPISTEDLDDIIEMRVDLERKAIALSIQHGDDKWEAELLGAFHMLSKLDPADDSKANRRAWWERHNNFHDILVSAAPSAWLLRFRGVLFDHSHRYRAVSIQHSASPGRLESHRLLMDAALRRDTAEAGRLIEEHIRKTAENVQRWLASTKR